MTWKTILILILVILIGIGAWAYERQVREKKIQEIAREQAVIQTELEKENDKLNQERAEYVRKIAAIKSQVATLQAERDGLRIRYDEIQNRLNNIAVPATLVELEQKFKGRGFKPVLRP